MTDAASRQAIYLETNFFIKAVEGTPETAGPPRKFIEALRAGQLIAATSQITIAETLAPPQRPDALPLHIKRRAYLDLLLWSGIVDQSRYFDGNGGFACRQKNEIAGCNPSGVGNSQSLPLLGLQRQRFRPIARGYDARAARRRRH